MGALRSGQMLAETSYRVVREIGAGGMGVVYEIEHVRLKKRYVAKIIHEQISGEEGAAKRMEREAQVLAGISHRNIVQVHDAGVTAEGLSYFVMEKLEGFDLRSMMKRQGVPRLRAIEIVTDLLDALEYVHRRGIVHRDIKPENIFLSEEAHGTVTKVLDFGIAHIFDGDGRISHGRITKTGGFVGTLYYAAPEQMQGKAAAPPNDVYAAGLVLFELLAGRGPFDDDPGVGLSRCFKPAPRLTSIVKGASKELSDVLAKALEQEPGRRPNAGALAAELRAVSDALRNAPGAAEDDALRAEIDDLLRRMPPIDLAPRSRKRPTPAPNETAAPVTPLGHIVDATSEDSPAAFDPTLASPSPRTPRAASTPPPAGGAFGDAPTFAATLPLAPGPLDATGRARPHETSPGLYATVDGPPNNAARNRWWASIAASATLLLLSMSTVAWLIKRSDSNTTPSTTSSEAVSSPAAAPAKATPPLPSASASGVPNVARTAASAPTSK